MKAVKFERNESTNKYILPDEKTESHIGSFNQFYGFIIDKGKHQFRYHGVVG